MSATGSVRVHKWYCLFGGIVSVRNLAVMADKDQVIGINDLPVTFTIKYLGFHPAKGLWGMKHTRKPVDYLVNQAKNMPANEILPVVKLQVNKDNVSFAEYKGKKDESTPSKFTVDMISYGVQDFVYTRVFSMIIVTDDDLRNGIPFLCHSFLCESQFQARKITYALAAAFQDYGNKIKEMGKEGQHRFKKFAIDLRTPEQQQAAEEEEETEA